MNVKSDATQAGVTPKNSKDRFSLDWLNQETQMMGKGQEENTEWKMI